MPHMFPQAALVDGADLLQQHDGVLAEPHVSPGEGDVGGQLGLAGLAGDGRRNHRRGMLVARIVLHDEHGAGASLLTADDGAQVGIEDIASFYVGIHPLHTP